MQVRRFLLTFLALPILSPSAVAQPAPSPVRLDSLTPPVVLDHSGLFQERLARVGDLFIAGQPTERGLREMKRLGVTTVINLRTPEEMRRVRFDEPALVAELGMRYVYIPIRGNEQYPYSPAALQAFSEALRSAEGKVLLHCTVAWRTSHLWAAYLIQNGFPVEAAIAHTRPINLMDTHRMTDSGRQPVEDFLGRRLPQLGRH